MTPFRTILRFFMIRVPSAVRSEVGGVQDFSSVQEAHIFGMFSVHSSSNEEPVKLILMKPRFHDFS